MQEAKILAPASKLSIDGLDQIRQRYTGLPIADQRPRYIPSPSHRLFRRYGRQVAPTPAQTVPLIAEGVTQEIQTSSTLRREGDHPGFLPVDRESKPPLRGFLHPGRD